MAVPFLFLRLLHDMLFRAIIHNTESHLIPVGCCVFRDAGTVKQRADAFFGIQPDVFKIFPGTVFSSQTFHPSDSMSGSIRFHPEKVLSVEAD